MPDPHRAEGLAVTIMTAMPVNAEPRSVERIYSRAAILAIEERFIADDGRVAFDLMRRAGAAAHRVMLEQFSDASHVQVLCGSGNNAGDGYVLAALAHAESESLGRRVEVLRIGRLPKPGETAWDAYEMALEAGVAIVDCEGAQSLELSADLLVDALLGTGVTGEPRPAFAAAIQAINACASPVLSLDLPSGMNPDTGSSTGALVEADVTVSFIGAKRGMATGSGKAATGTPVVDRLGLADSDFEGHRGHAQLAWHHVMSRLPEIRVDAHKNRFGHLLIIGGDLGMGGAAIMAAQSALRVGAGLVTLVTRPEHISAALSRCPEVMALGVDKGIDKLFRVLKQKRLDALVIGPGLGLSDWGKAMLREAGEFDLPMLADGDALTLLGTNSGKAQASRPRNLSIITPHPGEASSLLGCSLQTVNDDRFNAAFRLAEETGAVSLLKGAGSLIATPTASESDVSLCAQGNPGMATAGTGDVLAGMIGGLLVQGMTAEDATVCGACLHAAAGDRAVRDLGRRSLNASDLIDQVPELLRVLD